jgi:hypothetical protein
MKKLRVLMFALAFLISAVSVVYAYGEECNDGYTTCQNGCYFYGPPAPSCLKACRDDYWSCMNDEDRPYCPSIYYCPRETFTSQPDK